MTIQINRRQTEVPQDCTSLLQLLEHKSLVQPGIAVAVDNKVVPRSSWAETPLRDGMSLTIIKAVCGG
ncbi:MAG: sulfur carrier protein ThiS [Clostridium sp.]|nr:sulfur carrier protein ThiS [Clostridium sp.]